MKKTIVTLSALAVAIGSINFIGCGGGPKDDPNAGDEGESTTGGPDGMDDKMKAEMKKKGFTNQPPTTK